MTAGEETTVKENGLKVEEEDELKVDDAEAEVLPELPVADAFQIAVKFYRENQEKMAPFSYSNRVKLAALFKQVKYGKYQANADTTGFFDWFGSDRKQAWAALGELDKDQAMAGLVDLLQSVCPTLRNHLDASRRHIRDSLREEERRRGQEEETQKTLVQEDPRQPDQERQVEAQKRQIQDALNQQTYRQFRAYAEQQFPDDTQQQEALIGQLQEQHYQQYMSQVYAQQMQQNGTEALGEQLAACHVSRREAEGREGSGSDADSEHSDAPDDLPSNPAIAPASMWTRKDIKEFKDAIRKEGTEGIIKVGHGETVTVRVPTHEDGSVLFWEFSTDHYDIGFGVLFEWTVADSNVVSVHISESSDEDVDEDYPEGEKPGDVEKGSKDADAGKPQTDEIIPVYRRDCHEEVYAGSHIYPGRGVYLLKFDNSYSLWRSKTLFYRVYYSK